MTQRDFLQLLAYSDTCWSLLRKTLEEHPEAFDTPFKTTSDWNTIRLLLAHSIGAEERWITLRLQDLPLPVSYEKRVAATLDGLYADFATIRAATHAYIRGLAEGDLEEEKAITLSQWHFSGILSRSDVLYHIVNHDNYHRGQVVMALQRMGLDPPNFDYCFLKEPAVDNGD